MAGCGEQRGMKMGEELLYGKEKSMKLTKSAEVWGTGRRKKDEK
jgi:hypothetical protein